MLNLSNIQVSQFHFSKKKHRRAQYEVTLHIENMSKFRQNDYRDARINGKRVSPETLAVAESYRDCISDDLHNYYTITLKTPNYAGRLIRIMSIVHCIENIHYERSKVMELARIFDVFKVEVSEKGMFDC
ncbi:hypothetical protein Y032_0146g2520 [Ancylostoma ceylanicum]|uniref:NR LBD domain-containing protein n=1 Tax=Ancylostoma ceylanicum TaxID=53326 RepID=A0A016T2H1_9BILA|nr:hypothetical protein Y032_0146g2520 [Ancylostoma ceylanicum]